MISVVHYRKYIILEIVRHFKLEAEIASMTWKILSDELNVPTDEKGARGVKFGSRISLGRNSIMVNLITLSKPKTRSS